MHGVTAKEDCDTASVNKTRCLERRRQRASLRSKRFRGAKSEERGFRRFADLDGFLGLRTGTLAKQASSSHHWAVPSSSPASNSTWNFFTVASTTLVNGEVVCLWPVWTLYDVVLNSQFCLMTSYYLKSPQSLGLNFIMIFRIPKVAKMKRIQNTNVKTTRRLGPVLFNYCCMLRTLKL